jgi:hypothetical protein
MMFRSNFFGFFGSTIHSASHQRIVTPTTCIGVPHFSF